MTNAIVSDTTGRTLKKDLAYKVSVYAYGSKTHLDFDTEFIEELRTLIKLATQNGCEWYQLVREDDKWVRRGAEGPKQTKGGTKDD